MSERLGTRIFVATVWRGNGSQNFRPRENNRIECFFPKRRNRKPQLVLKAPMVSVFWCLLLVRGGPDQKFTSQKNLVILDVTWGSDLNVWMEFFGWMERKVVWNDPSYLFTRPFYMDVSENRGTPKSSILIGFSNINHPFWGTPIFGNTHMGHNPMINW